MSVLVEALNDRARGEGLVSVLATGRLIMQAFFDGDPACWRARGSTDPDFRALLAHPALEPSPRAIWYALAVFAQCQELPPDVAVALNVAHHRLLLPIPDPATRLALAREAIAAGWSKRRLAEEIRRRGHQARPLGRPRVPEVVHVARRVRASLDAATTAPSDAASLRRYGAAEVRAALDALRMDLRSIEAMIAHAERALAAIPEKPTKHTK